MNKRTDLILLGGGGHAAVVADAAMASSYNILGYLDDQQRDDLQLPYLGVIADAPRLLAEHDAGVCVHAAIGDASLRRQWLELANGHPIASIIHPSAVVSTSASISDGAFIGPLAIVNARAVIGHGCIINSSAVVEHDCTVGAFSHVAPRAVLAGGASVGEAALIGCGAAVLGSVHIGHAATLGACALAIRDVPDGATAIGVPAQIMSAV